MKKRKIVEGDVVHVTKQETIQHCAGEPIGPVIEIGKFNGLSPDHQVRRDRRGNILDAYYVKTQFGTGVYARNEIKMCTCKEHYAALEQHVS